MEIKNASLHSDGFTQDVFPRAPAEWGSIGPHRIQKLRAPSYGLGDAPAAFRKILQSYLPRREESSATAGQKFQVSSPGPRIYFVF